MTQAGKGRHARGLFKGMAWTGPHIFVWLDIFAICQQVQHNVALDLGFVSEVIQSCDKGESSFVPPGGVCPGGIALPVWHLRRIIRPPSHFIIGRACPGVLAIMDDQLLALNRSWCIYEMWACISGSDATKLKVCFPPGLSAFLHWDGKMNG